MIDGGKSDRYADFGVPELICDPFFQDGVINPGGESAAFWVEWVAAYPDKKEVVEDARRLLEGLSFTDHVPAEEQVAASLTRALEFIEKESLEERAGLDRADGVDGRLRIRRAAWLAAAAIATAVCLTAGYRYWQGTQRVYTTPYAQTRVLYLPDSSRVVLNAHSECRFDHSWQAGRPREVWLDGEAFFDVRPMAGAVFLVHSGGLTVEVLGTSFDIRNRRGKTEVVLQSGKVRLLFADGGHQELVMTPGDKIVYDPQASVLTHTETKPENYTSWKDKKLTDVSVGEIATYLEDNYHKTVIFKDTTMAKRMVGGAVLLDNLDDGLFALSTILNADIIQRNDTLIIQPR